MRDYILEQIEAAQAAMEDAKDRNDPVTAAYYEGQIYAFNLVLPKE